MDEKNEKFPMSGREERASTAFTTLTPLASARVTGGAGFSSALGSYPNESQPKSQFLQKQGRRNIVQLS